MSRLVFKIINRPEFAQAKLAGFYKGSKDDLRDGFIHLSFKDQVAGTLEKHFSGQSDLIILAFSESDLAPALRFEQSRGGQLFPHLYDLLPIKSAIWQSDVKLDDQGKPYADLDDIPC